MLLALHSITSPKATSGWSNSAPERVGPWAAAAQSSPFAGSSSGAIPVTSVSVIVRGRGAVSHAPPSGAATPRASGCCHARLKTHGRPAHFAGAGVPSGGHGFIAVRCSVCFAGPIGRLFCCNWRTGGWYTPAALGQQLRTPLCPPTGARYKQRRWRTAGRQQQLLDCVPAPGRCRRISCSAAKAC